MIVILIIYRLKICFKYSQIYFVDQLVKWVRSGLHVRQVAEYGRAIIRSCNHKIRKFIKLKEKKTCRFLKDFYDLITE